MGALCHVPGGKGGIDLLRLLRSGVNRPAAQVSVASESMGSWLFLCVLSFTSCITNRCTDGGCSHLSNGRDQRVKLSWVNLPGASAEERSMLVTYRWDW